MQSEPVRLVGYITTFATALITLLAAFGADISDEQRNAILAVLAPTIAVFALLIEVVRSKVVSPKSAGTAVALAKQEGPATTTVPEIKVAGFKEAVVAGFASAPSADTNDLTTVAKIDWQPPVAKT